MPPEEWGASLVKLISIQAQLQENGLGGQGGLISIVKSLSQKDSEVLASHFSIRSVSVVLKTSNFVFLASNLSYTHSRTHAYLTLSPRMDFWGVTGHCLKWFELLEESQGVRTSRACSLVLFAVTDAKTLPRRRVGYPIVSIISRQTVPQHCVGLQTRQALSVTALSGLLQVISGPLLWVFAVRE